MRKVVILVLMVAVSKAAAADESLKRGEAEVTADTLRVDHKKRYARFEGHVRAVFDRLTLTCQKMSLHYDDSGQVKRLSAMGKVTVVQSDVRATADEVKLDSKSGRLVLTGNPVLVKGPHKLTGERIEVDLSSGRLEVQAARGRFRFSKGDG
jgi:lipopolysaccharide transport protein LptA